MHDEISVFPKDYQPKEDEVFTKDEQFVAFAAGAPFFLSPIGVVFQDGHALPWWVIRENGRWQLAAKEWRGVADIFSRHSREVGRLKSFARMAKEKQ